MMRGAIGIAILFALAVALAVAGRLDSGYILIVYEPYRIDISLNFFIVASVFALLSLYCIVRLVYGLSTLPMGLRSFRTRIKESSAQTALQDALRYAFAGHFAEVEKAAHRAVLSPAQHDAASLIGAHAAHFRQDAPAQKAWLDRAISAKWKDAHAIHSAYLYVDAHEGQAALDALDKASTATLRKPYAQHLALRAHLQLAHWPEVLRYIALLERQSALKPALISALRQQAVDQLLEQNRYDAQALLRCWNSLSVIERSAPTNAERIAQLLIGLGDIRAAQNILEKALEKEWIPQLVRCYADCAGTNAVALIERAELWRAQHPHDGELLRTLGILCVQQQLWGKAQAFLEEGLTFAQANKRLLGDIHAELGRLHEALEQHAAAQRHYRECALGMLAQ